ncbi:ferrous iron transport protein B [Mahella sp.]|uniref:ferrous iron transport protein B n=1 Tax=Mahella sp. TaxID=2798721 RepID=UPI0025BD62C9|nr:ferrous iron transport protein B [Mahella sp.]MBZ4666723.1 ferrous iron transport protein [Mahella sp.]
MVTAEEKEAAKMIIALAGNPNSGKTTLFNSLTGSRQHVGNWPGVTVEKKEGQMIYQGETLKIIDLPGTYSLGAYSEDELVARNFLLEEKPDVVIDVVDATNLERNLYLTVQLLEMGANVVIALNMIDEAEGKKIKIDIEKLSNILGIPVIPTIATRNKGIDELIEKAVKTGNSKQKNQFKIDYGEDMEEQLQKLIKLIAEIPELEKYPQRWLALALMEGDERVEEILPKGVKTEKLLTQRNESVKQLENKIGEDAETIIIERRYGFAGGIAKETVTRRHDVEDRLSMSDKIDNIVTNRYLGIPIFLIVMWAVFQFTFTIGDPLIGYIELFFEWLGALMGEVITNETLNSLIVDGIIGGLGSVIVFIPPIFLLFFAISLLEDSGYMARAAYIMDRFMHTLGLHGKSFIPMLIGFGCNVPAIMATRTLDNKKDRLITILINPLMSCSARLPVYVLFAGALFGANQGLVIFSLYLLGIVLAIVMGVIFKKTLFKGETSYLIMELPPYRMPTVKSTLIHMWERGSSFVKKAGTIIFAAVILIWVLANLPVGVEYASEESLIGKLGNLIAPIFAPAGFGNWQAASALVFGLLAKEVIVGTLAVVYGAGEAELGSIISSYWTPLSAYAFMVMTLIYVPCVATIGAIKRETNSWGWTGFAVGYTLVLGWVMAVLVFQVGSLLGLG